MISAILDILSGIANFFGQLFDFIAFLAQEIFQLFQLAIGAISYVTTFLGSIPSILSSCFLAVITITLIYKIKE